VLNTIGSIIKKPKNYRRNLLIINNYFQYDAAYVSRHISNRLTKFFDSMTCVFKNCIFEVWINRILHYCKIWRLCRKLHHSGVKEFFHVSNCFTSGMHCSIILVKTPFGSSSCNLLRKGSNKSMRYLPAVTVWLKKYWSGDSPS
jgi:hypothetical protein